MFSWLSWHSCRRKKSSWEKIRGSSFGKMSKRQNFNYNFVWFSACRWRKLKNILCSIFLGIDLSCWECKSEEDSYCSDPFSGEIKNKRTYRKCPRDYDRIPVCYKGKNEGEYKLSRGIWLISPVISSFAFFPTWKCLFLSFSLFKQCRVLFDEDVQCWERAMWMRRTSIVGHVCPISVTMLLFLVQ